MWACTKKRGMDVGRKGTVIRKYLQNILFNGKGKIQRQCGCYVTVFKREKTFIHFSKKIRNNRDIWFSVLSHVNVLLIQNNYKEKTLYIKFQVYFWVYSGCYKSTKSYHCPNHLSFFYKKDILK